MTVFTIGYEGINIETFMFLLIENDIKTIVDIRELPLSRKQGFSKKVLSRILNLFDREYIHMANLGCPKDVREIYKKDHDWKRYTDGFQKHLKTQEQAIFELSDLVNSSNCALLCYEADFNFCHRSMVADAVHNYCGADVKHIKLESGTLKTRNLAVSQQAFF